MTSHGSIDYEALTQDALRSVVRRVLVDVTRHGLPGEHHFYIAFSTRAQGVALSRRLREKYPDEMTIVLQHRFWDLAVAEDSFEVKLTFDGIPERLVIPFTAVRVFFDPSVRYTIQFDDPESLDDTPPVEQLPSRRRRRPATRTNTTDTLQPRTTQGPQEVPALASVGDPPPDNTDEKSAGEPSSKHDKPDLPATKGQDKSDADTETAKEDDDQPEEEPTSAQILSLDAFRKK